MKGKCVYWSKKTNVGFIQISGFKRRLFIHHVDLINCKELVEGDEVEFKRIEETGMGFQARNVMKLHQP